MTFWKSQNSKTKTQVSGFQALEWMRRKVEEDGNVLTGLWCAYMTMCIYQNSWHWKPRRANFTVCRSHLICNRKLNQ